MGLRTSSEKSPLRKKAPATSPTTWDISRPASPVSATGCWLDALGRGIASLFRGGWAGEEEMNVREAMTQ